MTGFFLPVGVRENPSSNQPKFDGVQEEPPELFHNLEEVSG